jgi:hypothetical protein
VTVVLSGSVLSKLTKATEAFERRTLVDLVRAHLGALPVDPGILRSSWTTVPDERERVHPEDQAPNCRCVVSWRPEPRYHPTELRPDELATIACAERGDADDLYDVLVQTLIVAPPTRRPTLHERVVWLAIADACAARLKVLVAYRGRASVPNHARLTKLLDNLRRAAVRL